MNEIVTLAKDKKIIHKNVFTGQLIIINNAMLKIIDFIISLDI